MILFLKTKGCLHTEKMDVLIPFYIRNDTRVLPIIGVREPSVFSKAYQHFHCIIIGAESSTLNTLVPYPSKYVVQNGRRMSRAISEIVKFCPSPKTKFILQ